ncbi:MBL fold metallo-hydrolase [Parvibaculum sedimenti]|uniref:MBL fold metallo-hydrolase n=1 Tax=Parvibaculum sedimenti TaxID=2608632 RepID=A0A6N6VDK0_9HYPH|nr:MBL fold metallo-hydrolase [Parvibaculum sedimenti]KAB7738795.1 MBL fold metallo-hydrolase [Parvibaculum sedimenti]
MSAQTKPDIRAFFDEATFTVTYLVRDPATDTAAIIDPVLDYDPKSGKITTIGADRLLAAIGESGAKVEWILETHAHADHLSAAQYLKAKTGAKTGIGANIGKVQEIFGPLFGQNAPSDGREFDALFADGDRIPLGQSHFEVLATPGHTPACISYRIGDAVFVGDTLFMPDYGTARADFPGGDAHALYRSIHRILSLPPETRLFMCHDYKAPGRDTYAWETSVAEERAHNIHIHDGVSEDDYVAMREMRDAALAAPVLLLPSVQVNIRAGHLPKTEANGHRYLKIPLTVPPEANL